jgi:hypothetical protein
VLLASGLVTTTPTEQSPGDPQDVRYRTVAAGQMPKNRALQPLNIKEIKGMVVMSMLSDNEFNCTPSLVDFPYIPWFPNWD